jgi:hypothetical protein
VSPPGDSSTRLSLSSEGLTEIAEHREGVDAVRHEVEDEIFRTSGVIENGTASGILVATV